MNWHLKLFSLILATALWAVIAKESTSEIIFDVPVEYQNVPPDTEVIGDTAKKVEVRLRGPSSLIREISEKDISTVIDLDRMPLNGETTVPLNAQHVHARREGGGIAVLQRRCFAAHTTTVVVADEVAVRLRRAHRYAERDGRVEVHRPVVVERPFGGMSRAGHGFHTGFHERRHCVLPNRPHSENAV